MVMTHHSAPRVSRLGALLALGVLAAGAFVTPGLACPPRDQDSQRDEVARRDAVVRDAVLAQRSADAKVQARAARVAAATPDQLAELAVVATACPPEKSKTSDAQFFAEAQALEAMKKAKAQVEVDRQRLLERQRAEAPRGGGFAGGGASLRGFSFAPMATPEGPMEGTTPREYRLPSGKLKALTSLMARNDVPVWIERHDDHITVFATPRGHEVFAAFVDLINPGSASNPGNPSRGMGIGGGGGGGGIMAEQGGVIIERRGPAAGPRVDEMRELELHLEKLNRERTELEAKSKAAEQRYKESMRKSKRLQKMSDQIQGQADDANDADARVALVQAATSLELRGAQLEGEAMELEAQLALLEARLNDLERSLESLEDRLHVLGDARFEYHDADADGEVVRFFGGSAPPAPAAPPAPPAPPAPSAPKAPKAPSAPSALPAPPAPPAPAAPAAPAASSVPPVPPVAPVPPVPPVAPVPTVPASKVR